jgi:phosphatidylinositol alpha-1,6-mannosyltransferase
MSADILLVTELFPPAVGGSAALFANVYGRMRAVKVTVLADPVASYSSVPLAGLPQQWIRIESRKRGVLSLGEARQVWRVAQAIRSHTHHNPRTFVHTARPLPEGLPALVSRYLSLRPAHYVCWAHGEDLAAALTSREHAWLARRVCRNAATMIANSKFTADLIGSLGVPAHRVRTVYPGVDVDRFRPDIDAAAARLQLGSSDGPVLLSVGRLQRRKGHDLVIEAIALLHGEFPGLQYLIAGDGQERVRLEELVRAHAVQQHVRFLGGVSDDQLPDLYAACDIFVMPTRQDAHDVEGFGIVFLEAAAAGRPSIGGRNGGVPEAVAEGETGLLVAGTDSGELAKAIRTLARSPTLRAAMGAAGRRRVVQSFTWDRAAQQVEALHRELTSDT